MIVINKLHSSIVVLIMLWNMDSVAPPEVVQIKSSDRRWVTVYFKHLIAKRGAAFASGNNLLCIKVCEIE